MENQTETVKTARNKILKTDKFSEFTEWGQTSFNTLDRYWSTITQIINCISSSLGYSSLIVGLNSQPVIWWFVTWVTLDYKHPGLLLGYSKRWWWSKPWIKRVWDPVMWLMKLLDYSNYLQWRTDGSASIDVKWRTSS